MTAVVSQGTLKVSPECVEPFIEAWRAAASAGGIRMNEVPVSMMAVRSVRPAECPSVPASLSGISQNPGPLARQSLQFKSPVKREGLGAPRFSSPSCGAPRLRWMPYSLAPMRREEERTCMICGVCVVVVVVAVVEPPRPIPRMPSMG